jgi:hypothetical protein
MWRSASREGRPVTSTVKVEDAALHSEKLITPRDLLVDAISNLRQKMCVTLAMDAHRSRVVGRQGTIGALSRKNRAIVPALSVNRL